MIPILPGVVSTPAFTPIADDDSVPVGSIAHFDFASDSYWTQADGNLTAAEIISDPTTISPGVGYGGGVDITLIGPALAAVTDEMTVVVRARLFFAEPTEEISAAIGWIDAGESEDFEHEIVLATAFILHPAGGGISIRSQTSVVNEDGAFVAINTYSPFPAVTEIRVDSGFTLAAERVSVSTRGGEVATVERTGPINDIALALMSNPYQAEIAFESMTFYPVQDDADLPALSDIGAPLSLTAPVASGTPTIGGTVSVTNGTWLHDPMSYTYQWFAMAGATRTDITDATASTLVVPDYGADEIGCAVTAVNAIGPTRAASNLLTLV